MKVLTSDSKSSLTIKSGIPKTGGGNYQVSIFNTIITLFNFEFKKE